MYRGLQGLFLYRISAADCTLGTRRDFEAFETDLVLSVGDGIVSRVETTQTKRVATFLFRRTLFESEFSSRWRLLDRPGTNQTRAGILF